MLELTINNQVYQFRFGMGFIRDINKRYQRAVEGMDAKQDVGLQFMVARLYDADPEALVDVLDVANKTEKPRVSRALLDNYVEDSETDIDALFAEVLDFLRSANATKRVTVATLEMIESKMNETAPNT